MKYQLKIFIITLVILISTLLLNSVLSLASFEKIYVSSLVSTFEVVGQNLKRKIEQSLKFGKPLDKFGGMDILLGDVMEKNPLISQVSIFKMDHSLLYKSSSKADDKTLPNEIPHMKATEKETYTRLVKGYYFTYLPLVNRKKEPVGYINLIFSRNVVYDKLATMATENLKVLWVLMLITSTSLILFLAMLISRPIRKETKSIKSLLNWPLSKENTSGSGLSLIDGEMNDETAYQEKANTEIFQLPDLSRVKTKFDYVNVDKIKNELEFLEYNAMLYVDGTYKAIKNVPNIERLRKDIVHGISQLSIFDKQLSELKENGELSRQAMEVVDDLKEDIEYLQNELEPITEITIFMNVK